MDDIKKALLDGYQKVSQKANEVYEHISAATAETRQQLSSPLLSQSDEENSGAYRSMNAVETETERDPVDFLYDSSFREQLKREEEQVLQEIQARRYVEDNDSQIAQGFSNTNIEANNSGGMRLLSDEEVLNSMTDEEIALLAGLPPDVKRDAIADKRVFLAQNNRDVVQNSPLPSSKFKVTIPPGLSAGDRFRVTLPELGKEVVLEVPNGHSGGDTMNIPNGVIETKASNKVKIDKRKELTEDDISKCKFLEELPEEIREEELAQDQELGMLYSLYLEKKEMEEATDLLGINVVEGEEEQLSAEQSQNIAETEKPLQKTTGGELETIGFLGEMEGENLVETDDKNRDFTKAESNSVSSHTENIDAGLIDSGAEESQESDILNKFSSLAVEPLEEQSNLSPNNIDSVKETEETSGDEKVSPLEETEKTSGEVKISPVEELRIARDKWSAGELSDEQFEKIKKDVIERL